MNHRNLVVISLFATMLFTTALPPRAADAADKAPASMLVYIGTYTRAEGSKGIYVVPLDMATGKLGEPKLAAETTNPSFLAISPDRKYLYSVGEIANFEGKKAGAVSAFAIDRETGMLKLLNQQPSGGGGPCHVTVDKTGKVVMVANYGGGSVSSMPVLEGGKLGEPASVIQHEGSSVDPGRQKGPHAHSINVDPENEHVVAADLGLDKVLIYDLDPATGKLSPSDPPFAAVAPGSGPRHFAFHPKGKFAYVINEMKSTITAFTYDAKAGKLTEVHTVSTLPEPVKGNSTAEVQVHPSGKFVYGSNRGHDSIAVFSIDEATGKITHVEHEKTGGKTPRNFGIDPTGQYLLAANQGSGDVHVFRIDPKTGALEPTGSVAKIGSPVCVKFLQ